MDFWEGLRRRVGTKMGSNLDFILKMPQSKQSLQNQWNFNHFGMSDRCHGVVMLEAPYKNKGLVNSCFIQNLKISIKPKEFQSFWSVGSMSSTLNPNLKMSQIGIHPVLRDQQVLPEVRNQPLLLRDFPDQ